MSRTSPVTMKTRPEGWLSSDMPLSMTATTRPPMTALTGLPLPPNRLQPPMTAAPTAYSRVEEPPVVGDTELSRLARSTPATAASVEQMTKHDSLTVFTPMPARRAASVLPPTAYTCRPHDSRPSATLVMISSTSRTTTTIGTPLSEVTMMFLLRSWLRYQVARPRRTANAPILKAQTERASPVSPAARRATDRR